MRALTTVAGRAMPLYRPDIDTDQIMPKQFLKRVGRTGFGEVVFFDWRQDPDFVLNDVAYADATILVTGPNFGSGSSREHAPWGLQQHGFEAIVAPSFGDIFATNCTKIGLLLVALPPAACTALAAHVAERPATEVVIRLHEQTVSWEHTTIGFAIGAAAKRMLLEGLDEISDSLRHETAIAGHEVTRPAWLPRADLTIG
jgi:3-isopropylmalate/(R)-2-methylmalate dehydratase small subunit